MNNVDSRVLVADYVKFRLQKHGVPWGNGPLLPSSGKVHQTIRLLGTEFETRYNEVFKQMCDQLRITPDTAHQTFVGIVNELFSDDIKWGRIIALFSFSGALSVHCVSKEMPHLVDQVVDWVTQYIDNHLKSWILENGGWEGLVRFYEQGPDRRNDDPWPSFSTICGYAAGAVGVLGLGAILAHKS